MPRKGSIIPRVLLLQRSIPHYRLALYKQLSASENIDLTISCDDFNLKSSTGIASEKADGLEVEKIKVWHLGKTLLFMQLRDIRSFDVIILDISVNIISNPLYILTAKLFGVRLIGWGKGIPQDLSKPEGGLKRLYKKFVISCLDGLVLYGEISLNYFQELGFRTKPMFVAQNTIDVLSIAKKETLSPINVTKLRVAYQIRNDFVFGYFGKLTERKRVDVIIKCFELLRHDYDNIHLVIAGGGPDAGKIKKLIQNSPFKDDISFLGQIEVGKELEVLKLFDVYLSFSQGGLGILEAMASASLIVSTPELYPENELLEDNVNSLLSKDFSDVAFYEKMREAYLENKTLGALKAKAQEDVLNKATIEKMVESFELAVASVIKNKK